MVSLKEGDILIRHPSKHPENATNNNHIFGPDGELQVVEIDKREDTDVSYDYYELQFLKDSQRWYVDQRYLPVYLASGLYEIKAPDLNLPKSW